MASYPGKLITIYDIPHLANDAYKKSFSAENILSSFKKTGLSPLNTSVFTSDVFQGAYVTDRPNPNEINKDIESPNKLQQTIPVSSLKEQCSGSPKLNIEEIRPYPKAPPRKTNSKREPGKSRVYTDTPEKNRVIDLEETRKSKNSQKNKVYI